MSKRAVHVVKLGGSLLDLADWPARVGAFLEGCPEADVLMVVGGGRAADLVREWDDRFHVGEQVSHWLAIRAMQLNTFMVASVLSRLHGIPGFLGLRASRVVSDEDGCVGAWGQGELALADPLAWLESEDGRGVVTPHRWSFTSDSIAAHLATRLAAGRLILLKSALPEAPCDAARAAALGLVDGDFPQASEAVPAIEMVNVRAEPAERCVLK